MPQKTSIFRVQKGLKMQESRQRISRYLCVCLAARLKLYNFLPGVGENDYLPPIKIKNVIFMRVIFYILAVI